jgi:hypothetical protein
VVAAGEVIRTETPMRKRICVVGLATIVIAAIACVMLVLLPKPGITKANFARIQVGMQEAEVGEILGSLNNDSLVYFQPGFTFRKWKSYDCEISVQFSDGFVASSKCGPGYQDDRTIWQKMSSLLGRREEPTLPAPYYTKHSPEYYRPSPTYQLINELNSLEEATRRASENPSP